MFKTLKSNLCRFIEMGFCEEDMVTMADILRYTLDQFHKPYKKEHSNLVVPLTRAMDAPEEVAELFLDIDCESWYFTAQQARECLEVMATAGICN